MRLPTSLRRTHCWLGTANSSRTSMMALPSADRDGRIIPEIESLVVHMAPENRDWGYRRILGAMSNLGHNLGCGTVANILKKHGIEPAPERVRKTTWKELLQRHWELMWP